MRFSNIYHLIPFYIGTKSNVIPVYDCSYYFQGYVAQGFKSFFKENYDHYFFVADDLVLNPIINENNYTKHFRLKQNTCFLPGFITFHELKKYWHRTTESFQYNINIPGVEAKNKLPKYESTLLLFKKFGLEIEPLNFDQIWYNPGFSIREWGRILLRDRFYIIRKILSELTNKKYNLPYPLVGSYSDIFIVSSDAIKQFSHYCGVFATTKLFVEVALPTSLVLSAQEIITEKDLKLQGEALWTKEQYKILNKYENKLMLLLKEFPKDHLYLHPIKLSKWDTQI
ncbi:hypothetical protein Barb7_01240 [Bacteroidales bacterium Barb7]|nr:hypothetical protein Barb7_01240 [Bacteroidales bacterium Barb7]